MMDLTQAELIQILRKRAGKTQAELGAQAFHTTSLSGRTKIKNLELGKQKATLEDMTAIANALNIPVSNVMPGPEKEEPSGGKNEKGVVVPQRVFNHFPGLEECLSILSKALVLQDKELITYISKKISSIFLLESKAAANQ